MKRHGAATTAVTFVAASSQAIFAAWYCYASLLDWHPLRYGGHGLTKEAAEEHALERCEEAHPGECEIIHCELDRI